MEDFPGNDKYKAEIHKLNDLVASYQEKYEKELQHSKKLDVYTSLAPVAIIEWDIDFEIEYWNKAAEDIFEYSKDEVPGKHPWDFVAEDQRNDSRQKWDEFLKKGTSENFTIENFTKSGKRRICKWHNAAIYQDEQFVGITSVVIDVTVQKQTEKELIESKDRFKTLSSVSSEAIFLSDKGYGIDVNEAGIKMFGYGLEEIRSMYATELFDEESKEFVIRNILSDYLEPYEVVGVRKDGTRFPVEIQGKLYEYKGKTIRVTSIRDITQRKKTQREIKINEIKFRTIFESVEYGILVAGLDKKIIEANNSFCKMSGYSLDEIIGSRIELFFSEESIKERPLRYDLVEDGETVLFERTIQTKKGRHVPVEMISKFADKSYYISIFIDLTDRKRSEKALQLINLKLKKAKERAEESNNLKTAFLQNMSHEIRTPMNGIIGFSEMLNNPDITEERRRFYTDIIVKSSKRLLDILNDILDVSKIETGVIELAENKINLNKMLHELFSFYQPQAWERNLNFHLALPLNDNECNIVVDDQKLRQVLSNLLSNAIKFTEEGYIKLGYEAFGDKIRFYVEDTGIGIDIELHEKIFERFRQGELSTTRRYGGTGLGLSISQAYVKLLQGKLRLKSKRGEGSTFYFSIPIKREES